MAKYKIERLAGDAADGLAPQLPDFMRRKAHKIVVIGELGRVKFEEDESGGGDRTVTLRWLQVQPVVGEAAHRLRSVSRALWAAQNPQGELFGDFTVDLSPRTFRHMADEIGVQYYARLRFGVEEYVRQMGKLLEDDAASRSPQRWHEEVQFLHTALTAVLAAAEEPGQPSDLGPDVEQTLPLEGLGDAPADRSGLCNLPLTVEDEEGKGFRVECDFVGDPDSHFVLDGATNVLNGDGSDFARYRERVHAGMGGDGGAYAWPFTFDGTIPVPEGRASVEGGGEVMGETGGADTDAPPDADAEARQDGEGGEEAGEDA